MLTLRRRSGVVQVTCWRRSGVVLGGFARPDAEGKTGRQELGDIRWFPTAIAMEVDMTQDIDVVNVLLGLAWLGEVTTDQVRRLWLPTHSTRSAQRLLKELKAEGYVERRNWAV